MAYRGVLFRGFRLFGDNLVSCARGAEWFRYGWWFSEFGSCGEFELGFTFVKGGLWFRGEGRRRAQLSYGIKQVDSSDVDP